MGCIDADLAGRYPNAKRDDGSGRRTDREPWARWSLIEFTVAPAVYTFANFCSSSGRECSEVPTRALSTAAAAKISKGINSGSNRKLNKAPPRPRLTVSAAPTAVIALSIGVPTSKVSINTPHPAMGNFNNMAHKGAKITSGKPLNNQCTATLPNANNGSGAGLNTNCSSVPSKKSSRNNRSEPNSDDSNAATHITPVAMRPKISGPGPTAKGNKVTTITTNNKGFTTSERRRSATSRSRRRTVVNKRQALAVFMQEPLVLIINANFL